MFWWRNKKIISLLRTLSKGLELEGCLFETQRRRSHYVASMSKTMFSLLSAGLTSRLSFVVSNCELFFFPLVIRVRCGT